MGSLYEVYTLATPAASGRLWGALQASTMDNEPMNETAQAPTQQIYCEVLCVNSTATSCSQAPVQPLQFPHARRYSNAARFVLDRKWKN